MLDIQKELTRLIIEAESGHNDGYTREYYMAQLRDIYKQLKQLDFLNLIKMAKKTTGNAKQTLNQRKTRKGVHAKNKHSWNKNSKNYVKAYNGQGR